MLAYYQPSYNIAIYRQFNNQVIWIQIIFEQEMNHSISTMTGKTKIKIVFLGGQAVGKSSIIEKYIHDRFEETANPTVGIDFLAKNISHKAKNYRLQLWDTAGQQRFRSLIPSYLKDAHCALIVFDVTSKTSLEEIDLWVNLFKENKVGDSFIFLIGNKIDLDYRQIPYEQAKEKADKLGILYLQISAKTGEHVDELFLKLIQHSSESKVNPAPPKEKIRDVREQPIKQEQEGNKPNHDETGIQITTNVNKENQVAQNVVLKNQKIGNKGQNKKRCC